MRKIRRSLLPLVVALLGILGIATPVFADGIPPFP